MVQIFVICPPLPLVSTGGIEEGVDVINMSLGGRFYALPIQVAIEEAEKNGIIVVAASGNEADAEEFANFPRLDYPAAFSTVLSVGAINRMGERAIFSQYSEGLNFVGPGMEINSSFPGQSYHPRLSVETDGQFWHKR